MRNVYLQVLAVVHQALFRFPAHKSSGVVTEEFPLLRFDIHGRIFFAFCHATCKARQTWRWKSTMSNACRKTIALERKRNPTVIYNVLQQQIPGIPLSLHENKLQQTGSLAQRVAWPASADRNLHVQPCTTGGNIQWSKGEGDSENEGCGDTRHFVAFFIHEGGLGEMNVFV